MKLEKNAIPTVFGNLGISYRRLGCIFWERRKLGSTNPNIITCCIERRIPMFKIMTSFKYGEFSKMARNAQ